MAIGIKVNKPVSFHHYIAGRYTWLLGKSKDEGVYILSRWHDKPEECSVQRYYSLKLARLEFIRQMLCMYNEFFAGFSKVV